MNQKEITGIMFAVFATIVAGAVWYTVFIQKGINSYRVPMLSPVYLSPVTTPTAQVSGEAPTSQATVTGLLQVCPDKWYENRMPMIIDKATTRTPGQYFIYKGVRREISEFDINWIKVNCSIAPSAVY